MKWWNLPHKTYCEEVKIHVLVIGIKISDYTLNWLYHELLISLYLVITMKNNRRSVNHYQPQVHREPSKLKHDVNKKTMWLRRNWRTGNIKSPNSLCHEAPWALSWKNFMGTICFLLLFPSHLHQILIKFYLYFVKSNWTYNLVLVKKWDITLLDNVND